LEPILLPEIKCISDDKFNAIFVVEPLQPGFGVTVGNSLRRTLLSSLEGAAVTSVKIDGITHEFSTIPYIKEDVIEIILNLKKLRMKMFSDEPIVLKLEAKKEGPVTADMITKNSNVEITTPDLIIATIDNKKGKLSMEITIEKGRGYTPVEARENEKNELGSIAVDALYNPVQKVNYSVENTRVGDQTNLDKLTIEIETDGTIAARDTLDYAANILVDHFAIFTHDGIAKSSAEAAKKAHDTAGEDIESIKVEEINLSTRTLNALLKNDIKNIGDIYKHYEELSTLPGLGARAVTEIKEAIDKLQTNR
jgi:DNA-directed RNA polymerase subunit alpha